MRRFSPRGTAFLLLLLPALACGGSAAPEAPTVAPASGPATAAPTAPASRAGTTDVAGLKTAVDAGAVVVDVRTPQEFAEGHVPGALNIPVDEIGGRIAELEAHRGGDLYLICAVGGRSARATALLSDAGFAHPINVDGGTRAWLAAGYPVE
jgi:phage shock protein E